MSRSLGSKMKRKEESLPSVHVDGAHCRDRHIRVLDLRLDVVNSIGR